MQREISAFLFPGQGSQYVGMGLELLEKRDFLSPLFKKADEILGFPLSNLAFYGPSEVLNKTVNAQPAILLVSVAYFEALRYQSILPNMVGGHSLGEYTALVAAEVLSFEEALLLVRKRGELMEEAYGEGKGGMAAILGLEEAAVMEVCRESSKEGQVWIANYNCPGQLVISGEKLAVDKASLLAKKKGAKRVVPLNVSGPFHSPLMASAKEELAKELKKYKFSNPAIRFFTNVEGKELLSGEEIKQSLVKQIISNVAWDKEIREMVKAGAKYFYEVGPGQILSGLVKRIDKEVLIKNTGEVLNGVS